MIFGPDAHCFPEVGFVGTFITVSESGYTNMWLSDGLYLYWLSDTSRYENVKKRDKQMRNGDRLLHRALQGQR